MHRWEEEHGTAGAEGAVARVVYASQAAISESVYAEMEDIRASALKHNEPVGVATALLHQSGWFVQWKEGPGDQLLKIMDRVALDPRHRDLRIVHRSRGPRLLAGPWSMAIVQCRETRLDMERRVLHLKRQVDAGLQFTPPAIWRRLSTPMQHPGAVRQQDPDAFQRVLACAASGNASFDLVHALGQQHGEEVVHRRFAGERDRDVGTDYVDFEHGGRIWRVIAMARNGLHLPLTRAFLPDYSHLVLLLAQDPAANVHLVQRVLGACAGLQQPPALVGVARDPGSHAMAATLARRAGLPYLTAVADAGDAAASWEAVQRVVAPEAANDAWLPTIPAVLQ